MAEACDPRCLSVASSKLWLVLPQDSWQISVTW